MQYGVSRFVFVLLVLLGTSIESAAQSPQTCGQQLSALTVPRLSYALLADRAFEQRVYIYVPEIKAGSKPGFQPFQVWVVEGIYARPFIRETGGLSESEFLRLRESRNVRATPVAVARGGGSDWGRFTLGRNSYQVQVLNVNAAKGTIQMQVCR